MIAEKAKAAAEGYEAGKRDSLGNSAAMREALRWIIDWSDVLFRYRNDPATIEAYSGKIFNMAQSALAEPVRNCDKYSDKNHARARYNLQSETLDPFEWLYATAEKGGAE